MADLGIPRRRMPTHKVGALTYYLVNFFPENCMKIREIGLAGRMHGVSLRSVNGT